MYHDTICLMAGSSHASGPNLGITIISPALFLTGFENVHNAGLPKDDNQAGLITVHPV